MASIGDREIQRLLDKPNHAVISTLNEDGTVHSTVVWQEIVEGALSFNSAVGRHWPTNLERDPRITVLVYAEGNPYEYVEVYSRAYAGWGEQFILHALLQGKPADILWPGHYLQRARPDLSTTLPFMANGIAQSFWFRLS